MQTLAASLIFANGKNANEPLLLRRRVHRRANVEGESTTARFVILAKPKCKRISPTSSLLTHFVAAPLKMVTASLGHDFAISPCLTHLNIQKAFV